MMMIRNNESEGSIWYFKGILGSGIGNGRKEDS